MLNFKKSDNKPLKVMCKKCNAEKDYKALKENFIGNNFYTKHGGKIFKEFKKEICYTTADMVVFEFKI